jgi:hypothetical protein
MPPSGPVAAIKKETGDALRSVTGYDREEMEIKYIREDIGMKYTEDDLDRISQDLVLQNINREHFEDMFNAGRYECGMLHFEDAFILHFPRSDISGFVVSIDTESDIDLNSVVETCQRYIEGE